VTYALLTDLKATIRFDALRSSIDPVYRSSMQYSAALQETQRAVLSGAATQAEANRVLALAETQYLATGRAAAGMSQLGGGASGQLGNISAQFNDIGVMLAAGQNPLQLALQQGTQLIQVFDSMGIVTTWSSGLEDAFVKMGRTGKLEVGSLVDYTLEQFQRMAFQQAIQPGIEAGFGFLTDFIGGFFPGSAAGSAPLTQSHAGSTIGTGGVRRSYGAGSPLRADERLTVTTMGQRVFTPEQIGNGATVVDALAQAAASGGGGGGVVFAPKIMIENNSSTPVQGEMEERNDGQGGRSFKLVLADQVGAALSQPGGGARKTLKQGGFRPKRAQR
jgi:hypothetical protein